MIHERDGVGHIRSLTSLRFLAALWVLMHHALPRGTDPSGFRAVIAETGWLGVSLFFVLSGFLLTVRYAPQGSLRGTRSAFWSERVARLAPTYVLALIFALPLFVRDARVEALGSAAIAKITVATLTLQQSWRPELACEWNCPAWSLSVETWFYIAFPFVIAVLGAWFARSAARGAALVAISFAASAVIFPWLEAVTADWLLPLFPLSPLARWPEFLAGIGLAVLIGRWRPASALPGRGLLLTGSVGLLALLVGAHEIGARGLHLLPIALPGFVLVIAGCWALRDHSTAPLEAAPLVLLGEASYALYLFHAPLHSYVLALVNRLIGRGYDTSWAVFGGYLVLSIGLSVLIFQRFERPTRSLLRSGFGLRG